MTTMTLPYLEECGPPCRICQGTTTAAVWSDDNWTPHPPAGGSLPGTVWLAEDALPNVPDEELAAAAERVAAQM